MSISSKRECVAEFGAYVHASGGETNSRMEPRSIECIYILPSKTLNVGHKLLNLNTKKFIHGRKIVVLPITAQVIHRVNGWAREEGVTSLKFFDKYGQEEFLAGDQIAGVDDTEQGYAEEAFDEDFEPEDDEDDENADLHDVNRRGRFDDIEEDEDVDLIMDAIDNVFDENEDKLQDYLEGELPQRRV